MSARSTRSRLVVGWAVVLAGALPLLTLTAACDPFEVSRALGARCEDRGDCLDSCLEPSARTPGGFCTIECLSDAECSAEAACVDERGGVCLLRCLTDADCAFLGETAGLAWACAPLPTKAGATANACIGAGAP